MEQNDLRRVILFLALCHTIIVDEKRGGTYNAASPDELALVNAAKQFGYIFIGTDSEDRLMVQDEKNNKILKFKVLYVCEFTSSRKRMSVILRDE